MSFSRADRGLGDTSGKLTKSEKHNVIKNIGNLNINAGETLSDSERRDILSYLHKDVLRSDNIKKIVNILKKNPDILNSLIDKLNTYDVLDTNIDPKIIRDIIHRKGFEKDFNKIVSDFIKTDVSSKNTRRSNTSYTQTRSSRLRVDYTISQQITAILDSIRERIRNPSIREFERKLRGLSKISEVDNSQLGGETLTVFLLSLLAGVIYILVWAYYENYRQNRIDERARDQRARGGKNTINMPKKYSRNRRTVRVK
jgi:hypothetical protein